jgi:error-prone DNA polymerase
MDTEERLFADYGGTGLTIGKHPMAYRRAELRQQRILSAQELRERKDGEFVRTAGCVIARQRPGTAKGFIFLSMEDETSMSGSVCWLRAASSLWQRGFCRIRMESFM